MSSPGRSARHGLGLRLEDVREDGKEEDALYLLARGAGGGEDGALEAGWAGRRAPALDTGSGPLRMPAEGNPLAPFRSRRSFLSRLSAFLECRPAKLLAPR